MLSSHGLVYFYYYFLIKNFFQFNSSKKRLFLYGRWTDVLKCTDYDSYENYLKENPHKFKRSDGSKSPNSESPAHTPRKVFSKLNSLKMSSFRSLSIQDNDHEPPSHDKSPEPETVEMTIPKSQSCFSLEIPNSETLWTVDPRPEHSTSFFSFTNFAMSLNEIEPHMKNLCPTDSRLRPDIRKLENGDVEGAIVEKNRLEEKQRDERKSRKSKNGGVDDWQPRYIIFFLFYFLRNSLSCLDAYRWFRVEQNSVTRQDDWIYKGGYWEDNYKNNNEIRLF